MSHDNVVTPNPEDEFTAILKSARPGFVSSGCPADGFNRIHRIHKQSVRSRRNRLATVAAVVLVMIPVLIKTNVVSNVLELLELKGSENVGRIFRFSDGSLKFNVMGDHTDEEIMEYGQQSLAEEGVITGAVGFTMEDESHWFVMSLYQALGGEVEAGRRSRDPANTITDTYRDFILNDWESYRAEIESGTLEPVGSETVELDGHSFRMQVWEFDHPQYGTIKYLTGDVMAE